MRKRRRGEHHSSAGYFQTDMERKVLRLSKRRREPRSRKRRQRRVAGSIISAEEVRCQRRRLRHGKSKVRAMHPQVRRHPCAIGNRVQWFRGEAEMFRWLEQLERKHGDFMRSHKSMTKLANVWTSMSELSAVGRKAFARQTAAMFKAMTDNVAARYARCAKPQILNRTGESFANRILDFRRQELGWMSSYGLVSDFYP